MYACMLSQFSHVQLFVTPWTVALQAPLSMGFSRQEYWSGLPCPPGDLPDPRIEPTSLKSPALAEKFFTTSIIWELLENTSFKKKAALVVKNPPASTGDGRDVGLIPGSGRSPGVGNGNPLQYSCLENSMDRGAWRATVHKSQRVVKINKFILKKKKSWAQLSSHHLPFPTPWNLPDLGIELASPVCLCWRWIFFIIEALGNPSLLQRISKNLFPIC